MMTQNARALAENMDDGCFAFMRTIARLGGAARIADLGPQTSQDENRARQRCKRMGLVTFTNRYWSLTEFGRAVAHEIKSLA